VRFHPKKFKEFIVNFVNRNAQSAPHFTLQIVAYMYMRMNLKIKINLKIHQNIELLFLIEIRWMENTSENILGK